MKHTNSGITRREFMARAAQAGAAAYVDASAISSDVHAQATVHANIDVIVRTASYTAAQDWTSYS